jgi:hypothetical protein
MSDLERLVENWAEYEQTRLYRQSSLSYADERYQWRLDKNLEKIGARNPWRIVSQIDPRLSTRRMTAYHAFANITRSTAPRRHTTLDEFGYCFRSIMWEAQCQIVISHFEGYEMLATLRIVEGDRQWSDLMTYLSRLSPRKEELSKIIAASWLALRVEWRRRCRRPNSARSSA